MARNAAHIIEVEADSPAQCAGIQPGEYLLSINGQPASDYIDWLWESDGTELDLEIAPTAPTAPTALGDSDEFALQVRHVLLRRESLQQGWGLVFDELIYDKVKTCVNDCAFCFMAQLPTSARKTLCVRDDDYRLSFLQGNFITLTNLGAADRERIVEQRISPLRLSFHAADPAVRAQLIGKNHVAALDNFDALVCAGVDFHIQIVLVPGVNDGAVLEGTLAYLADPKRIDRVLSVGIVPVAYTKYAPPRLKELLTTASTVPADRETWCKSVIEQVRRHQFDRYENDLNTWVHLADEFYIHGHEPFPKAEYYDDFPQIENGIGMVLNFISDVRDNLDALQAAMQKLPTGSGKERVTIVCGELLTQTWLGVLGGVGAGGKLRLLPVKNRFFGGNVSVTGLLTAADIIRAIQYDHEMLVQEGHKDADQHLYLIPDCIFNENGITLDDKNEEQVLAELATNRAQVPASPLSAIAAPAAGTAGTASTAPLQAAFYNTGAADLSTKIAAHAEEDKRTYSSSPNPVSQTSSTTEGGEQHA